MKPIAQVHNMFFKARTSCVVSGPQTPGMGSSIAGSPASRLWGQSGFECRGDLFRVLAVCSLARLSEA